MSEIDDLDNDDKKDGGDPSTRKGMQILSNTNQPLYDVVIEAKEEKADGGDAEALLIRIALASPGSSEPEFLDEFLIRHKQSSLLREVLLTLYHCFSDQALANRFVRYHEDTKTLSFALSSNDQTSTLSTLLTVALSKSLYSNEQAIRRVLDANKTILKEGDVICINAHMNHDPSWEMEVTISQPAGLC